MRPIGKRCVRLGIGLALGASTVLPAVELLTALPASATTTVSFSYTGADQSWTVPAGVTSVGVDVQGAQGGVVYGGFGARVQATISTTPGDTLGIYVGGTGTSTAGGFNGGGGPYSSGGGGGGGGASDIRDGGSGLANRIVVAGGGGGDADGNATSYSGTGGAGGGLTGEAGYGSGGGGGGTASSGGANGGDYATDGSLGTGGNGGDVGGGGGGGGYYGGGGGSAGGGGGSSYAESGASSVVMTQGYESGNGQIIITYPPTSSSGSPTPGSATFSYTGSPQTWQVPTNVTEIGVVAMGAQGGGTYGGLGAEVQAEIPVIPGQYVDVLVGGTGAADCTAGFGGAGGCYSDSWPGAGGGGATDLRIGGTGPADRAVVAAGGGGDAGSGVASPVSGTGGSGGTTAGEAAFGSGGGGGGTASAGGANGGDYATDGSFGEGGGGGDIGGGGGGGGYYGGGGGSAGGGGGSSYAESSATDVTMVQGYETGDGQITITYPPSFPAPSGGVSGLTTFSYTGEPQFWTVPAGVAQIAVDVTGASGAGTAGGLGGETQALVPVVPGETVVVVVGSAGDVGIGGYNGGGDSPYQDDTPNAGGGASDVRIGGMGLADRAVVAGGAGGDSSDGGGGGGAGGGLSGGNGGNGSGYAGGSGGTQDSGVLGVGAGGTWPAGGAGGGGYRGGGAGGSLNYGGSSGGGGGGSGYAEPSADDVNMVTGENSGDGSVTIDTDIGVPLPADLLRGNCNPLAPGACPSDDSAGDPVVIPTGDFYQTVTDASIPTYGPPLEFTRTYDASLAQAESATSSPGPLGYGWTDNWGMALELNTPSSGSVTVVEGSGSEVEFDPPSAGSCTAPEIGPGTSGTSIVRSPT